MSPNNEYIAECIKILKRFLKEKGVYAFVMKYLFDYGRNEAEFYNDAKRIYDAGLQYGFDFGDIFHLMYTLGPAYDKLGHTYWVKNIEELSDEFKRYFKEHKPKEQSEVTDNGIKWIQVNKF